MKPPSGRDAAVKLRTARGRSTQQQNWLRRQLNDPYVHAARREGFRSRAAFKLIELDERYHLIRKGALVLDLGAAPGGWTQVALKHGAARVVGIDLLSVEPIPGATLIQGDITDPAREQELLRCSAASPTLCCPTWRRTPPATPGPITSASWRWRS